MCDSYGRFNSKRRPKNGRHAFSVDSPPKVRLEDRWLFSDPSAAHDTLPFYCTMLGHEESRVSVAYIENWRNGGKKRSACLRCWFATEGTTGRHITLHRSFCCTRYFTVLLYYARTWRISSFSSLYWKLTKRRQKIGRHAFYAIAYTNSNFSAILQSFWRVWSWNLGFLFVSPYLKGMQSFIGRDHPVVELLGIMVLVCREM